MKHEVGRIVPKSDRVAGAVVAVVGLSVDDDVRVALCVDAADGGDLVEQHVTINQK